jgi:hypothetical protein
MVWSTDEDARLTEAVKQSPSVNWIEMAQKFPGKTQYQLADRWTKVLDPSLIKGSWTQAEDQQIITFVHAFGTKNWTKLASLLPGRIGKQCRERWRNHLNPLNNNEVWSAEEDAQLAHLHAQFGNQWVKIAACMNGRTDNSVKNRWNSTLKRGLVAHPSPFPRVVPQLTISIPSDCPPLFSEDSAKWAGLDTGISPRGDQPMWSPRFPTLLLDGEGGTMMLSPIGAATRPFEMDSIGLF